jgi:formylglycine-generating enzyme required for sulfatase activity
MTVSPTVPEMQFQPGGSLPGFTEWRLEERLAEDEFGELWRARHAFQSDRAPVLLRLVQRPELRAALKRDRQRLQMLTSVVTHAGLSALSAVHFLENLVCLESECPEGEALPQFIQPRWKSRNESWSTLVTEWLAEIAGPIGLLHRFLPPVVHGNLTGDKVIVRMSNSGEATFKVIDWVIAGVSPTAPANGVSGAHAAVSSQEESPGPRDDVLALCLLWHQMLTGKFTGKRPGGSQWRKKLLEQGVSAPMLELLEAGLADDPSRRPIDADALVHRLGELKQEPPSLNGLLAEDGKDDSVTVAPTPIPVVLPTAKVDTPARPLPSVFDLFGKPGPLPAATPVAALQPAEDPNAPTQATASSTRKRRGNTVKNLLDRLQQPVSELSKSITNSIGMKLILLPPGTFQMGSPPEELGRRENEGPRHDVTIGKPFYMSVALVTQQQYQKVMGENPSQFHAAAEGGPEHPVERVTWLQAVEFCRRLSELPEEKENKRVYALPTEGEWEYACRAGTNTPFSYGTKLTARQANFDASFPYADTPKGQALGRTTKVGVYAANNFGIFDMHGNVWEWCADWYDASCYTTTPRKDPQGPKRGLLRVIRGGSWRNHAVTCRAAYRNALAPNLRDMYTGFRVMMRLAGRA